MREFQFGLLLGILTVHSLIVSYFGSWCNGLFSQIIFCVKARTICEAVCHRIEHKHAYNMGHFDPDLR